MSVIVDSLIFHDKQVGRLKPQKWCHMTADTREELHAFAERIGLRRNWFQDHPARRWHYDLTEPRRIAAIANGACEVTNREYYEQCLAKKQGELFDV